MRAGQGCKFTPGPFFPSCPSQLRYRGEQQVNQTMSTAGTTLLHRTGIVAVAVPLLYGVIPLLFAYSILRLWTAERTPFVICGVVFLVSGATMLISVLLLFVTWGRWRLPLWAGGAASLTSATVLVTATLTEILPCSGPD